MDIETAVTLAKKMKEDSNWADLLPQLDLVHPDEKRTLIMLDVGPGQALRRAVAMAIAENPCEEVVFISDARARKVEKDELATVERDLQKEWLAGRRDQIVECMIVFVVQKDLSMEYRQICYDAEARTWEDPTTPEGLMVGGIPQALQAGMILSSQHQTP